MAGMKSKTKKVKHNKPSPGQRKFNKRKADPLDFGIAKRKK